MRKSGHITIFLSLAFLLIFSLFCGLIESARTAGARHYLKLAADSATDSVFSGYHKQTWDKYRLFLLESRNEEELLEEWKEFIKPYMDSSGWYSMDIKSAEIKGLSRITEHGGEDFKQEIMDYMRYGIFDHLPDELAASDLQRSLKEAAAVKEISSAYCGHTKEAVRLEKALEDIVKSLQKDQSCLLAAYERLDDYDGTGFRKELGRLEKEMNRMEGLVKTYRKRADDLKKNLEETDRRFTELQGELSGETLRAMKEDVSCYKSYTEEDGRRRREIEALPERLKSLFPAMEQALERSYEVEEIIDSWESDDEDDEGPDVSGLWRSVRDILDGVRLPSLPYSNGVKDPEKEQFLEQVAGLVKTGLLSLILPEGSQVSEGVLDTLDFPSNQFYKDDSSTGINLLEKITIDEYCGIFLTSFLSEEDKAVKYELEYLNAGKNTDEENLKQAAAQILMVREGMNLVHILSDSQKREEAKVLAGIIAGLTGTEPLVQVIVFFIMGIWALGEAILDLKLLLEGKKVSFLKTRDTWNLSLDGLLELGKHGSITGGAEQEQGLDYTAYLKLLLFTKNTSLVCYRLMDVIQMNIRRSQDNFRMSDCVYWAEIHGTVSANHLFFGGLEPVYDMDVRTEKAY